jgi:hypothetical protein
MKKLFWLPLLMAVAAYVLLPLPGQGASLDKKISKKRVEIEGKKRKEGVLTKDIQRYNNRIRGLQAAAPSAGCARCRPSWTAPGRSCWPCATTSRSRATASPVRAPS